MGILKLLEHGLLEAARTLETYSNSNTSNLKAPKVDKKDEEEEEEEESGEEFEQRIHIFVTRSLERASSSMRDDYKDGQVYQARKDIILAFLKLTSQQKCRNCHAYVSVYLLVETQPYPLIL